MRALTKKNLYILGSILLTFAVVQLLINARIINSFYEITIAMICINIILAVSLNLVTGFTGQFSLGHAGFMSIGAYVCAIITMEMNTTLGFLLGILGGAVAATIVGILIGIPTLRLRGDYLAIATLGMAEIIRVVFLNLEITNGAAGLNGIPRNTNWFWLCFFTIATILLINNFIKSSHGRACISIREDEIAAESMGINTTKYKVMAFAIGAFFAGVAGALYASYFYFLKPDLFGFLKSIDILVIVVLGGMGSLTGSVIAAIVLAVLTTFLQSFTAIRMILYAALLVLIMIFRPQGIMGTKEITDLFKFRKKDERIE
ncbi:branched-chain amino acid ABC transporter permease [Sinanaerobacter chloroacetimidivorans]|jgi:branched-chain amino acid transport system permease protein|uniref:Branched-chain amino acid ABC transporter permease n=1 Tax=Sinanaerobacter chloroacetimidivorans TaxID=2818044 RepID=A0A8J7W3K5_9FIRM|nr:branched-chain amino acid ABC transporter permease [Sinanaerobacter chloroacetimidivorans]MBR0600252.1 branched-chain amino acid ABC transporter permease [Sinanaerobacter chloroacetimidivorans]